LEGVVVSNDLTPKLFIDPFIVYCDVKNGVQISSLPPSETLPSKSKDVFEVKIIKKLLEIITVIRKVE